MNYTELEFNIKCAEFMGFTRITTGAKIKATKIDEHRSYKYLNNTDVFVNIPINSGLSSCGSQIRFNPYSNANDRNKVIEKMGLVIEPFGSVWQTSSRNYLVTKTDKSRDKSQNACIWAILESEL